MNIDIQELEHEVHTLITQLSIATAKQGWGLMKDDVKEYGLTSDAKIKLAKHLSGSLLDESGAVPLSTKLSVWKQVFAQFSETVAVKDYPEVAWDKKDDNRRTLNTDKIWGCLCMVYTQEITVRNAIESSIASRLQSERRLKM